MSIVRVAYISPLAGFSVGQGEPVVGMHPVPKARMIGPLNQ